MVQKVDWTMEISKYAQALAIQNSDRSQGQKSCQNFNPLNHSHIYEYDIINVHQSHQFKEQFRTVN